LRRLALLAVGLGWMATGAACETVDLGTPPADINACRPGQQFFIDQIWPNVLGKDYAGKRCYDSSCHDNGKPLTLAAPAITMMVPIPLPMDWMANYISASEQMNCSNVKASPLLAIPAGIAGPHGGGKMFDPNGPEALLLQMWVTQP
jgi:hypothetical protein